MSSSQAVIVRAAGKILNESGLEAVTIRSVADAANFGRSTVTHHFHDKNTLLAALHVLAIESFACHVVEANFSPANRPENLEAQSRLLNQIGVTAPEEVLTEAAAQIYLRFRDNCPGYWEILRFRSCPDFDAEAAPTAHALVTEFCGGTLEGPIGLTVDVIVHQLFSLHEWASVAKPGALLRIMHNEPSLNYWLAAFGQYSPRTPS